MDTKNSTDGRIEGERGRNGVREGERGGATLVNPAVAKTLGPERGRRDLPNRNYNNFLALWISGGQSLFTVEDVYSKTWKQNNNKNIHFVDVESFLHSSRCLLDSEILNFCFLLLLMLRPGPHGLASF